MESRNGDRNRGVSETIGAILVFGLVVIALAMFQTTAVPASNEQAEFDHNQEVQTDLLELDAELSDAAATGNGGTTVVTVGMDYPNRFLFRNPPPVSGSLSTEPAGFTITNARAVGAPETAHYWDGSAREYDSNRLVYRVDYNVYDEAPTTVLAYGTVYDRFPGGQVLRIDEGGLVDGRRIELTALQGRRDTSRVGSVSVPVSAESAPTRTVRVNGTDDPVRLTLQTDVSAEDWREDILASAYDPAGNRSNRYVSRIECLSGPPDEPCDGSLEITFEPGTYELRMSSVAVGPGATEPAPHYVTAVTDTPATTVGTPVELTAEVRDRFNGPKWGVDLRFSTTDGTLSRATAATDEEGRATVRFTPDTAGTATVTASADLDGNSTVEPREAVTFEVPVASGGTGGGSGGGGDTTTSADRIEYVSDSGEVGNDDDELRFDIENTGTGAVNVTGFSIDYRDTNKIQGDGPEVRIDASTPGEAGRSQGYNLDGTGYSLDRNATIAGTETATITLANFRRTEFDSVGEGTAADNDITVTLTFADGSSKAFYFDITTD